MHEELRQAPDAVANLLAHDAAEVAALARMLRERSSHTLLTLARGSSDCAASYFAYLVMTRIGRVVASLPMSVVTMHDAPLDSERLISFAFSQSGQAPDLVVPTTRLREGGAETVAFLNQLDSGLARSARWVLGLHAGTETSVAATKSFIAQMTAGARLVMQWRQDALLMSSLHRLPQALERALAHDWQPALDILVRARGLYVIGRGTGLSVAQEAALKMKETCNLHAEAVSAAELRHGPMALVEAGFPLLVFALRGPTQPGLLALAHEMRVRGATVLLAAPASTPGHVDLPLSISDHEDLDPIVAIQSFYVMVEQLSRLRGLDPDAPRHLSKATHTR